MISWVWKIIFGECFHKWGDWMLCRKGRLILIDGREFYGYYKTYRSECIKCRIVRMKDVGP